MGWACGKDGETRNACGVLVVNPLWKLPLARPKMIRGWGVNIQKQDLGFFWAMKVHFVVSCSEVR
jgi:hypothetical protein